MAQNAIELRVNEALASVLRSGRSEFNAQFAEARRLYPKLDGAAFLEFLRADVNPLIEALGQTQTDGAVNVVMAAYEAGLELVGQNLIGPGARNGWLNEAWRRVLRAAPGRLAEAPARVIGAVSNVVHNLTTTPGARPEEWIAGMEKLGPECRDVTTFLRLGQVLAWKSGLAHFRKGAIAEADSLPAALALAAVGAAEEAGWSKVRNRLMDDPWCNPAKTQTGVRLVKEAGAFRGFGGLFVEPPHVAAAGEHFLVRSGQESWLLTADLFGATFHRSSLPDFESAAKQTRLPAGLKVADSKVVYGNRRVELPAMGKCISAAANGTTLALTFELTHAVLLVVLK